MKFFWSEKTIQHISHFYMFFVILQVEIIIIFPRYFLCLGFSYCEYSTCCNHGLGKKCKSNFLMIWRVQNLWWVNIYNKHLLIEVFFFFSFWIFRFIFQFWNHKIYIFKKLRYRQRKPIPVFFCEALWRRYCALINR